MIANGCVEPNIVYKRGVDQRSEKEMQGFDTLSDDTGRQTGRLASAAVRMANHLRIWQREFQHRRVLDLDWSQDIMSQTVGTTAGGHMTVPAFRLLGRAAKVRSDVCSLLSLCDIRTPAKRATHQAA